MSIWQILYGAYLNLLAAPFLFTLIIIRWKRSQIRINTRLCGLRLTPLFFIRFYYSAVMDLLRFLHGHYGRPIQVRTRDMEKLETLKNGSSLYLTGHFHNWELMGAWMGRQGIPLVSAARSMAQPLSHSLLVRVRTRLGMKVLFRDIPRQALRHLAAEKCFALLWDQRVPSSDRKASLFGHSLSLDPLPFFLTGHLPVNVLFGALLPNGQIRLVQIANPLRGKKPFSQLGRRYHRVLEILVRAHPHLWYGLAHSRFREVADYSLSRDVSRETMAASEVMVSRETKLSG